VTSSSDSEIVILIVDDHPMTRNMVKAILRGGGFEKILQAEDGHDAIMTIRKEKIDMIICDWNMPTTTGLEVLQEVRSIDGMKELPFIMLTAEAYRENVVAAAKAGVTDYCVKPFTAETLLRKVNEVLGRKR
jgi:two-component system, chemotaxis family, chemotaxis protein CheY